MSLRKIAGPLLFALALPSAAHAQEDLLAMPTEQGLPLDVRTALYVVDITQIDDNAGTFDATVDLRLLWQDARLAYPAAEAPTGFREWKGEAAAARLATQWAPDVALENLAGEPESDRVGLRISPDGSVELLRRVTGTFRTDFDVARFPFDHQRLAVDIASPTEPLTRVTLDFRQRDVDFTRINRQTSVEGWQLGSVALARLPEVGWHGDRHARVRASIAANRAAGASLAPVFIPLVASLLIPILALWLNESEEEGFKVDAFELTNLLIGGLFAVIALNFTVNSEYTVLSGDNPVNRLFGLNYLLLGVSFAINIGLFRFNLAERLWGPHVRHEVYTALVWGLPSLVAIAAAWVLCTAAV